MYATLQKKLTELADQIEKTPPIPHPLLSQANHSALGDDWVANGVVLYYNHATDTDDGTVFSFVYESIRLLKRKGVKYIYLEDQCTVDTLYNLLKYDNDRMIARKICGGNAVIFQKTLSHLTMTRVLREHGIELRSLKHGTHTKNDTQDFPAWYEKCIIDRDEKAVEYTQRN